MLRHGERPRKLPEDHLLPRFSRDTLSEELRRRARVEVRKEAVDAGFSESREPNVRV